MLLAEAASNGHVMARWPSSSMSDKDRYELKIAGLLHDCGKVTTPVHVVDKATKLQTLFDRIQLVDTRFEVLKRDAEITMLKQKLTALRSGHDDTAGSETLATNDIAQLDSDREFLRKANIGGEFMSPATATARTANRPVSLDQRSRARNADFLTPRTKFIT